MDFLNMTDAELIELNKAVSTEITKRKEAEKDLAREELIKLLDRVNELQDKYDFKIYCQDIYNDCIDLAHGFELTT